MRSPGRDTRRNALISCGISSYVADAQEGLRTVKELARYLRMSERWIHERTRRDEIPCHRLGTALRFDPQEVHVWMIQRRGSTAGSRGAA